MDTPCDACGRPATDTTDHNADPVCRDCLATWAELDDAAEYRTYAYH